MTGLHKEEKYLGKHKRSLYAFTKNSNDTKTKVHYIKDCKNPTKSHKIS